MDWNALTGLDAKAAAAKLSGLTAEMAKQLEERPETAPLLMDLLARHLGDEITTDTYTPVFEGITAMFGIGEDAPRLYSWLASSEQRERLDALVAQSPASFGRLLRNSVALYGQSLQDAYRRWREYPDNWDAMHRQTYFDRERGQSRIDLTILKYNQEEVVLNLDPRSLLLLVTRLMNSLALVASGPFVDAELEGLRGQSDAFWEAIATNLAESATKTEVAADGK